MTSFKTLKTIRSAIGIVSFTIFRAEDASMLADLATGTLGNIARAFRGSNEEVDLTQSRRTEGDRW